MKLLSLEVHETFRPSDLASNRHPLEDERRPRSARTSHTTGGFSNNTISLNSKTQSPVAVYKERN